MYAGGLPSSSQAVAGGATIGAAGVTVLPYTGAAVILLAVVGVALLGVGMVLLGAVKRRRSS